MEESRKSSSYVGKLEVVRPKPVGFLCGSIPVPTDKSFHAFNSALVPSSQTCELDRVSAPRYRVLPTDTDLNMPPRPSILPEKLLPVEYGAGQSRTANPGIPWDDSAITCNLSRKGEALAVSGLVEYGDEIDVIAPADILKQIFKMPYAKARLSIAVHRVGQTLILNAGPDVEEGERLVRRNHPKCSDESLFLNFAMHSVRMEACDCPPTHSASMESQSKSSVVPDVSDSRMNSLKSSDILSDDIALKEGHANQPDISKVKKDDLYWKSNKNKKNKAREPVKKASHIGEKPRRPLQESEQYGRDDEFLRVLFWQFHNFRMLLGSDLLLFSNDKYVSVSLHLWDVSRQVTPLTWLDAWLDNVMASVPELAICYHQNGVVQGYELLKTDDIFLLKGVTEDGTPAFHPYVVQQNGLSVLRFLQANCKQDPGAYWLCKNAGEDAIQLFDLAVIPQNHPSESDTGCSSSLPSLMHRGRADSLLSLGTLLYRIAHRLSLSVVSNNRVRCASFVKKCLELLGEPDHLVVRAFAHEQFARLILTSDEEFDLSVEAFSLTSENTLTYEEEESLDIVSSISGSSIHDSAFSDPNNSDAAVEDIPEVNVFEPKKLIASDNVDPKSSELLENDKGDEDDTACDVALTSANVIQTIADPISSKLAAVHHVSQAIKSLRWTRQLQGIEPEFVNDGSATVDGPHGTENFSVCACGDTDCIEVCDIREWLPKLKLDNKLWKLILLLGESYLALGQAYKEDGQLLKTLKVIEAACSVYGSVPQYLEGAEFVSSMGNGPTCQNELSNGQSKQGSLFNERMQLCKSSYKEHINIKHISSTYLFWAKAWTLVGDVYVEFLSVRSKETSPSSVKTTSDDLRMSSEVVKELVRLKKKLSQDVENCSSCSLVNCSCQSDRVSSSNSASSSSGGGSSFSYGRRLSKRSYSRRTVSSLCEKPESNCTHIKGDLGRNPEVTRHKQDGDTILETCDLSKNLQKGEFSASSTMLGSNFSLDNGDSGSSMENPTETTSSEAPKSRSGGIFKYLGGLEISDPDDILAVALSCYEAAREALGEVAIGSHELQSVLKKIGWVCNELGRSKLEGKDLAQAELAFAKAVSAFKEVSDHTNVILTNCNLGHGRRALAEELVSKLLYLKSNPIFRDAYKQALDTVKMEYSRSLKFYRAAKSELNAISAEEDDLLNGLRNEVFTQLAHTYLRLGMLLAGEDTVADVYVNGALDEKPIGVDGAGDRKTEKGNRKCEISANDALRKALSFYESLGELRKQEAAYAYFQLACYQRDCCLKYMNSSHSNRRQSNQSKIESSFLQRTKQYLSLAERNWQKAVEFYSAKTHPVMYLTIMIERADLLSNLSSSFHSYMVLETALSCMLDGRHVTEELHPESLSSSNSEVSGKFWRQLQMLLKKMLASSLPSSANRTAPAGSSSSKRFGDAGKLRELYKMSLKSPDFHQLHSMNNLWIAGLGQGPQN